VTGTTGAAPAIRISGLSKRFGDVVAVDDVSLDIVRGEFFALLGASGCGKTTLLRLLAGFELPDSGRILIDGIDLSSVPPYARPLNMMFQSYALFPHMTVEQNVSFGLRQERLPRRLIRERVDAALDLVQLRGLAARRPHQLSGGQRQRVALARAVVKEPKVLLLDEPLSALDRKLREATRLELVALQRRLGITFVMVTHDQEEALASSDRVAVMDGGRLRQVGTPADIYEFPASRFVADFIGLANRFEAKLVLKSPARADLRCEALGITVVADRAVNAPLAAPVSISLRPEKIMLSATEPASRQNAVRGTIEDISYQGNLSLFHVVLGNGTQLCVSRANTSRIAEAGLARAEPVWLSWVPSSVIVLTE